MKPKNAILLMLGVLFLAVIISIFLIFLETSIPVVLILALGVIYIIFIDLILLYETKPKQVKIQPKQLQARIDPMYNHLLKTSIELDEKLNKLNERERQLRRIAEDSKKTIKLNQDIKKHIKAINPQKRYLASIMSNKFHSKKCKFTKLIVHKNKVFFKTKNQALKQGFKPCNELKHN